MKYRVKRECFTRYYFIYASSDENGMLACAFEEHRYNLRNSQSVFLMVFVDDASYPGLEYSHTVQELIRYRSRILSL